MAQRASALALATILLPAAVAHAEGLAIDHHPVGCIVAGKYARLNACFAPSAQLARARVYFRVADGPPEWFYVEMRADAPCFAGVLPKPKKQLVGHNLQYYLNAFDRGFAEVRSDENAARVVEKASDCDPKVPIPPLLEKASVTVFPGLPAGFSGAAGVSLGATAAIVGGGAALAGGTVAVTHHSGGGPGPVGGGGPTTTAPPDTFPSAPTPTTTTTTTTTFLGFKPVFNVFQGGVPVNGSSISGPDPLVLDFDMCASSGPFGLLFAVSVDGTKLVRTCRSTIAFSAAGAVASGRGGPVHASGATPRSFNVRMQVLSNAPFNDPQASQPLTVVSGANNCGGDTAGPNVRMTLPAPSSTYPSPAPYPVHMEAFADDSKTGNNGVSLVEYKIDLGNLGQVVLGPVTSPPYAVDWADTQVNQALGLSCFGTAAIQAYAVDGCGNASLSPAVSVNLSSTSPNCLGFRQSSSSRPTAAWTSDLAVAGGSGQLVVNGEALFPRAGRSPIAVRLKPGENRVEATLVEARAAGSWRFELAGIAGLARDSVRVVAGEVVQAAGDSLEFRLQGRPGERIVFSFRVDE